MPTRGGEKTGAARPAETRIGGASRPYTASLGLVSDFMRRASVWCSRGILPRSTGRKPMPAGASQRQAGGKSGGRRAESLRGWWLVPVVRGTMPRLHRSDVQRSCRPDYGRALVRCPTTYGVPWPGVAGESFPGQRDESTFSCAPAGGRRKGGNRFAGWYLVPVLRGDAPRLHRTEGRQIRPQNQTQPIHPSRPDGSFHTFATCAPGVKHPSYAELLTQL
jgi:hypothetical protein